MSRGGTTPAKLGRERPRVRLSKSRIAAFEHCPKRLWLQVHKRELAVVDARTRMLFATGHRLGELARQQVANGILLETDPRRIDAAIEETRSILNGPWTRPIFEAALIRDGVVVRPDILQPDGWGGWKLIEVKNSVAVRPYQLRDVATQTWVAQGSGLCISSVIIRHSRKRLANPHARALPAQLVDVDVSAELRDLIADRPRVAAAARQVIRGPEPERAPGPHCTHPFSCEFRAYCTKP